MFHRLYDKKDERLSALEKEIKYNSPDASDWVFRIYSLSSADQLEVEVNRRILENNTLEPAGMNTEIRFSTKESFLKFAEAYAQNLRESAKKCVNPIRVRCILPQSKIASVMFDMYYLKDDPLKYVTGFEKRDLITHFEKIELLLP